MFRIMIGIVALCDAGVAWLFRYRIPLRPPFAKHRYAIAMGELVLAIISLTALVVPAWLSVILCMFIVALSLLNVIIAQFIK